MLAALEVEEEREVQLLLYLKSFVLYILDSIPLGRCALSVHGSSRTNLGFNLRPHGWMKLGEISISFGNTQVFQRLIHCFLNVRPADLR